MPADTQNPLEAELSATRAELQAYRSESIEAAITAACSRGAIAPQDRETQDRWRRLIAEKPEAAGLLSKVSGRLPLLAHRMARSPVQIVGEDTSAVLRGFLTASNPRDKGLIYAREISPRMDAGENVLARYPVEATNTLGTLANALVSQRTLELMYTKRPLLKGVVTDFSAELASLGDTIETRTVDLPTVQPFGSAPSAAADSDVTVTLDQHVQVYYSFTAAEVAGTSRNLVAERAEANAIALGNAMVDALAAKITEVNFGTTNQTILASADVDYTTLVAINQAMNTAGVPDMGRFAWVNGTVAASLSNDQFLAEYADRSAVASAYAAWKNVKGFDNIWEFPSLPHNSINLTGFFASRSALVVAARVPRDASALIGAAYPGTLQVVTNPVTGLSVVQNEWITPDTLAANTRLIALYGVSLGQAACGHTLVSAA